MCRNGPKPTQLPVDLFGDDWMGGWKGRLCLDKPLTLGWMLLHGDRRPPSQVTDKRSS
jgi:hypothetical protein